MRVPLAGDYVREGDVATFTFDMGEDMPPAVVTVAIVGEEFDFYPERSSGHKRVLAALGYSTP